MSKGVKTLIGIAVAIAIPFAAPAIAGAIGASAGITAATFGMSATVGSVLGSAAVGAALGGASQAVLGGDVGRGALMGAIGGGIGGYTTAPTAAAGGGVTPAAGTAAPTAATTTAGVSPVDYSLGTGGTPGLSGATGGGGGGVGLTMPTGLAGAGGPTGFTGVDYSLASGAQFPTLGLNPATAGVGLRAADPGFFQAGVSDALTTGTPIDYSLGAYVPSSTGLQVTSVNPVTGGTQVTTGAGTAQSTTPISGYSGGSYVGPTGTATGGSVAAGTGTGATTAAGTGTGATSTAKPMTFTEALSKVPGEIAAKFTDPKTLADLTLRAAGTIAGSVIAGDGLSDQERTLLTAQTDELRALQQTNAGLFAQRLEQAQNLMGESKYFDPEYFGLQRARRAQTAAAKAKRAGLRGLEGAGRAAEARRFDLATARDVGTSFDQGYLTGVGGRLQTMQAGMQMMPTSYPSSMGDYTNLRGAYTAANQRARETQGDIGNLFGSLTGNQRSQGRG
jgi:hypothetical protein